jgi:hypothetical protein
MYKAVMPAGALRREQIPEGGEVGLDVRLELDAAFDDGKWD